MNKTNLNNGSETVRGLYPSQGSIQTGIYRVSSERTQSFSQYCRDDPSPIKGVKLHLPSCNTTRWLKCKGVLLPKQ